MARILVVDDDQDQRLALTAMLDRAGHQTVEAGNGHEALERFGEGPVDVVVTDLQMPELHGLELITLLRDRTPRPEIIAISGTGSDQLSVAEALGARVTLAKPIFPGRLIGAVDEALAAGPDQLILVVSDPPHDDVDLERASAITGLDVFQTRLKFIFPAPEVLAATGRLRADQIARAFRLSGVRSTLIDGRALAELPWPDLVSAFAFTDTGLTATLRDRTVTLAYDTPGVGVFCSPPPDFPVGSVASPNSVAGDGPAQHGPALAVAMERMSNLDLYFVDDDGLQRLSIAELTDFSGLGSLRTGTPTGDMEATLSECMRRFTRTHFDIRLRHVRPRRRFVPGVSVDNPDVRRRYSFGTPILRDILEAISPELSDLTQYELGSRLGYVTSRERAGL